jgi:hypothetical protein
MVLQKKIMATKLQMIYHYRTIPLKSRELTECSMESTFLLPSDWFPSCYQANIVSPGAL